MKFRKRFDVELCTILPDRQVSPIRHNRTDRRKDFLFSQIGSFATDLELISLKVRKLICKNQVMECKQTFDCWMALRHFSHFVPRFALITSYVFRTIG